MQPFPWRSVQRSFGYAFHKPGVFANAYPLLIGSPEEGIVIDAAADELSVRVYTVKGEIRENFSMKAQR